MQWEHSIQMEHVILICDVKSNFIGNFRTPESKVAKLNGIKMIKECDKQTFKDSLWLSSLYMKEFYIMKLSHSSTRETYMYKIASIISFSI